jgi:hypothetical protein
MSVSTLHTKARARQTSKERIARQTVKRNRPLPPWFDGAVKLLCELGLNTQQLAAVAEHLGIHRSATHVPVLNSRDAARLQGLIDGSMPADDGSDTPRPEGAPDVSQADWTWWCEQTRAFQPAQSVRTVAPSARAQAVAASYALSPESARWISGERRGHYA